MSTCLSSKDPDGPHFRHSHYLFFWQLLSKPLHYCPPSVVSQMQVMNQLMVGHSSLVVSKKNQLQWIRQKEKLVETQVAHRVDRRLGTQPWNGTGTNRNWSSVAPESHWWVCSKCSLLMMPCSLQESQSHGNSLPVKWLRLCTLGSHKPCGSAKKKKYRLKVSGESELPGLHCAPTSWGGRVPWFTVPHRVHTGERLNSTNKSRGAISNKGEMNAGN